LAPATGEPSGKYLKDDGTWATVEAGASPAGSGTEIQYRNDSALGAIPNSSVDGATGAVTLARLIAAANGAASTPPMALTGTWFTGGTATTTKPALLIEPTGTTSTAWSTSGTGLGVNAPSGFPGNLLDLQVNGSSVFTVASNSATIQAPPTNTHIFSAIQGVGFFRIGGPSRGIEIGTAGFTKVRIVENANSGLGQIQIRADAGAGIEWHASSPTSNSAANISLARLSSGKLIQAGGTSVAQSYLISNTFTSNTNYELGKLEWENNVFVIGTQKGSGGGTARPIELQTDGTTRITVKADGAILFSGIPASNPNVAGQLWNDGGTLKISAG
jgi:hypothetical protein